MAADEGMEWLRVENSGSAVVGDGSDGHMTSWEAVEERGEALLQRQRVEQLRLWQRHWDERSAYLWQRHQMLQDGRMQLPTGFWSEALTGHATLGALVEPERDRPLMRWIRDVRVRTTVGTNGEPVRPTDYHTVKGEREESAGEFVFCVVFDFDAANPFFVEDALEKVYRFSGEDGSLVSVGCTEIGWRAPVGAAFWERLRRDAQAARASADTAAWPSLMAWLTGAALSAVIEHHEARDDRQQLALAAAWHSDLEVAEMLRDQVCMTPQRYIRPA